MRSSVIETLGEDYVTTARAKGLTDGRSCARTRSRTPCCRRSRSSRSTSGYVIGGAITVEVVFNWPGLGTLTVDALDGPRLPRPAGDLPAAERSRSSLANLVADLVYGRLDPRVRS